MFVYVCCSPVCVCLSTCIYVNIQEGEKNVFMDLGLLSTPPELIQLHSDQRAGRWMDGCREVMAGWTEEGEGCEGCEGRGESRKKRYLR